MTKPTKAQQQIIDAISNGATLKRTQRYSTADLYFDVSATTRKSIQRVAMPTITKLAQMGWIDEDDNKGGIYQTFYRLTDAGRALATAQAQPAGADTTTGDAGGETWNDVIERADKAPKVYTLVFREDSWPQTAMSLVGVFSTLESARNAAPFKTLRKLSNWEQIELLMGRAWQASFEQTLIDDSMKLDFTIIETTVDVFATPDGN